MKNLRGIEITFPAAVEITSDEQRVIHDVVRMICQRYENEHPERVMWPFGMGQRPIERMGELEGFDETRFSIDCSERERYESERDLLRYTPPRPAMLKPLSDGYSAWLIETVGEHGPQWLADDHEAPRMFSWTNNADEAIHFSRESDAQSVMACNHIGHGRRVNGEPMRVFASEHMRSQE